MWTSRGRSAENKQPTFWHAKVSTLLGTDMLDTGQVLVFVEPCSCSVLNWALKPWIREIALEYLPLFWGKHPMIWRGFKRHRVDLVPASVGIHADIKCCSGIILKDLLWIWECPHYDIISGIFSIMDRWSVAPHLSFPSIQSHAKGLQYHDSIVSILGANADFRKAHLSAISQQREKREQILSLGLKIRAHCQHLVSTTNC